jgi:hypothetical protein
VSFSVPTFNLTCGVWSGPWLAKAHRFDVLGNLAFGRRSNSQFPATGFFGDVAGQSYPLLLMPAGTDVRCELQGNPDDVVEIPVGSGRWYQVMMVEDIGKGFLNEHRCACVMQIANSVSSVFYAGLLWPTPMT